MAGAVAYSLTRSRAGVRPAGPCTHQFHADIARGTVPPGSTTHQRPYSFEFLCLGADILERDLQRGVLVCPPWTTCCDIRTISPPSASFSARADSLRDVAAAHDISAERPAPLTLLLRELKQQRKAPPSTDQFLDAWHVEETADAPEFATDTVRAAQQILLELTSSYPYGKA